MPIPFVREISFGSREKNSTNTLDLSGSSLCSENEWELAAALHILLSNKHPSVLHSS